MIIKRIIFPSLENLKLITSIIQATQDNKTPGLIL